MATPKPVRRAAVDSFIKANRAATPAAVTEQRSVPRLSIQELNASDVDSLRERFAGTKLDTRGPVTRFLDAIDVPRSFVAGRILAPAIRRRKEAEGEVGTFGEGKVYFSDILQEMGVENHVIRGLLGFVGDVATDPLTFAGPIAGGARTIGAGGKTLTWTKRYTGLLKEAAETGQSAHPLISEILTHANLATPEERSAAFFGAVKPKGKVGSVRAAITGEPIEGTGSKLLDWVHAAKDVDTPETEARLIDAAKRLYEEGGRAAAPGLRIGPDAGGRLGMELSGYGAGRIMAGSGALHIPWTDYGVFLPAATPRAITGIAGAVAAQGRRVVDPTKMVAPDLEALKQATQTLYNRVEGVTKAGDKIADLDREASALRAGTAHSFDPDRLAAIDAERQAWHGLGKSLAAHIAVDQAGAAGPVKQAVTDALEAVKANPMHDPSTILYAHRVADAADASAKAAFWEHELGKGEYADSLARRGGLNQSFEDHVNAKLDLAKQVYGKNLNASSMRDLIAQNEYGPWLAKLEPKDADLFGMSSEGEQAMGKMVEAFHSKMEANAHMAQATRAPLLATMGGKDKALAKAAQVLAGLGPEDAGYEYLFTPMQTATKALFDKADTIAAFHGTAAKMGQAVDQGFGSVRATLRKAFGVQSGSAYNILRAVERSRRIDTNPAAREIVQGLVQELRPLGLNAEDEEKAWRLVAALAIHDRFPAASLAENPQVVRAIADARTGGMLDKNIYPDLADKIKDLAGRAGQMLDEFHAVDLEHDPTMAMLRGYFPNVVRAEAQKAITYRQEALGLSRARQGEMAGKITEAFESPRASSLYKWKDAAGKEYSFTDGQRVLTGYAPREVEKMDDVAQRHINAVKEAAAKYDAMPPHERPTPIAIGPMDLNSHPGMMWLTGGVPLMEDNAAIALGQRAAQSEKSWLRDYMRDLADSRKVLIPQAQIQKVLDHTGNTATVKLVGGAEARLEKTAQGMVAHIGSERYRQPDIKKAEYNIWGDHGVTQQFYPEAWANAMERANKAFSTPEDVKGLLKAAAMASSAWKQLTLFHPSWTLTDIFGNLVLIANMGLDPVKVVSRMRDAGRIALAHNRADTKALEGINLTVRGGTLTGAEAARQAGMGVLGASNAGETAMQTLANGVRVGGLRYNMLKEPKAALGESWSNATRMAQADAQWSEMLGSKPGQMAAKMKHMVVDETWTRRIWKPWLMANAMANDTMRMAAFLTMLDEGHEVGAAASHIATNMLDMTTLTPMEHQLRKFVPFYSWTKASGVYGMRQLLENPKFFSVAPELKHNLEEAMNGEANVPPHLRPRWMRDMQAIQFGTDPDTRRAVLLTQALPSEAAMYMAELAGSPVLGQESFLNGLQYFGNTLGPPWKNLAELTAGREFYTGRTIDASGGGDLTPMEYLGSQIRPLKELGIGGVRQGPIKTAFQRSPLEGVARAVIGGKIQPATDDRMGFQNLREFKDREQSIRKRINLAEREGDQDASLRARALLLRLYEDARRKGLKVPAWGARQVDQMASPQSTP